MNSVFKFSLQSQPDEYLLNILRKLLQISIVAQICFQN